MTPSSFSKKWQQYVSLTSALLAVLSTLAAYLVAEYWGEAVLQKNEAILEQSRAADQWAYYQAKSVKGNIAEAFARQSSDPRFLEDVEKYNRETDEIDDQARQHEQAVITASERSEGFSKKSSFMNVAITLFQAAITLCAIAAITKLFQLWYFSLAITAAGIGLMVWGVLL